MRTFGFVLRLVGFVSAAVSIVLAVMVISQMKADSTRCRFVASICLVAGCALDVAGILIGRIG